MDAIDFSAIDFCTTDDPIFVPGHVHDEACTVRPVNGHLHRHDEYCYLSEAIWQVAQGGRRGPKPFSLHDVAVFLEEMGQEVRHRDPEFALAALTDAISRKPDVSDVPHGPQVIAAVEAELVRMVGNATRGGTVHRWGCERHHMGECDLGPDLDPMWAAGRPGGAGSESESEVPA